MRRILVATAALMFVGAGAAMAAGDAEIEINASQAPECVITAVSTSLTLQGVNEAVLGQFEYKCNFNGVPNLNFKSTSGGVVTTDNDGGQADYGIYLNDNAPSSDPDTWLQASAATGGGVTYPAPTITTATVNDVMTPSFYVGLSEALPVAGDYTDTLTITLTP